MDKCDFILASGSPRRKDLLKRAGYRFKIQVSSVDEDQYRNIDPVEHAKQLAAAKANDIAQKNPNDLVLGADTIAACQGQIIGKPTDAQDAQRIVRLLFSQPHQVITGVAFICKSDNLEIIRADKTVVYPKIMSEQEIEKHIKSGSWQGKAGAYAIQETGDEMVEKIEGSMTNVMGLCMESTSEILGKLGIFADKY